MLQPPTQNPTTAAIIARLPQTEIIGPTDIALAFGLASSRAIIEDIQRGKLGAAHMGRRYLIARHEAIRYILTATYTPDEA